jgi:hypothetical protein
MEVGSQSYNCSSGLWSQRQTDNYSMLYLEWTLGCTVYLSCSPQEAYGAEAKRSKFPNCKIATMTLNDFEK